MATHTLVVDTWAEVALNAEADRDRAIAQLFDQHFDGLCDLAYLILGDRHLAEEIVRGHRPERAGPGRLQRGHHRERAVRAAGGTGCSAGNPIGNLEIASGAYSCARCHTLGWSYDPATAVLRATFSAEDARLRAWSGCGKRRR